MRYVSLFSGIEAATVAWEPLGWEPVAFCEIDKFPSAVLAHHYPNIPNLGDITKVDWKEFLDNHGAINLIVGGSPCQSFSIAGGRASLDGESALCFEYWRAVRDVRPPWFLWENVPGVFSTRDNAFGQFLGKMEELGYGMAWATLDAQFFGVAQRRRRVFLVGHLGDVGCAAAVLFDSESVRGNTQPSKQKREELARAAGIGAASGGFKLDNDVLAFNETQITSPQNGNVPKFGNECHTLAAKDHPPVIAIQGDGRTSTGANGNGYKVDGSMYTLNCTYHHSVMCMADDNARAAVDVDLCGSLKVGGGQPLIATGKTSSGRSAHETTRASATST